jgi:acetyltransferase-like isoleucine patch superfamily enzyme
VIDGARSRARAMIKRVIDTSCRALVAPCAWSCAIDSLGGGEAVFVFWSQCFALVPGSPGVFVRRAYYRSTLTECHGGFFIGFGAMFSHRGVIIEDSVYVGPYAIVGLSRLRRGCLIGSRASIISGAALHEMQANGTRTPTDQRRLRAIEVGEGAWVGEGALVMADIGRGSTVAAGAVVSSAVVAGVVVAGNPARFVRHVAPEAVSAEGFVSAAM